MPDEANSNVPGGDPSVSTGPVAPQPSNEEIIETNTVSEAAVENELNDIDPNRDLDVSSNSIIGELRGILAELHLSGMQIVGLIMVLFVIGGLILASFYLLFGRFSSDDVRTIDPQDEEPVVIVVEDDPVDVDDGPGFFERLFGGSSDEAEDPVVTDNNVGALDGLREIDRIGRDAAIPSTEPADRVSSETLDTNQFAYSVILMTSQLAQREELGSDLGYYVRTYRRMRNTFNTDLFAYLDAAIDRQATYNQFVRDFKSYLATARVAYEDLRQETEALSETLERLDAETEVAENAYLAAAAEYRSEDLEYLLGIFQNLAAQRAVALSELRARQQIVERYENAIPIVEQRIVAIEANKDAFVKAVRVIDFPNVDLDLVVESAQ